MIAYFKTYLQGLGKRDDSMPPQIRSGDLLITYSREETQKQQESEYNYTDRTEQHSVSKSNFEKIKSNAKSTNQQHPNQQLINHNRSCNDRMGQYLQNKQNFKKLELLEPSEIILKDQKFVTENQQLNVSPKYHNQRLQQQSPKKIAFSSVTKDKKMYTNVKQSDKNKYQSEEKGTDKIDQFKDEYKKYLNTEKKETHIMNQSCSVTVQCSQEKQIDHNANPIVLYNDALQEQRIQIDIAPTPTSLIQGFNEQRKTIILNAAQIPALPGKAKQSPNKPSYRNSGEKGKKREMTYESERSSIFNENVQQRDSLNRNNLPAYSNNQEQQKRELIEQYLMQQSSSEDNPQQNLTSNIQQFLELNMRMSNITILQEKIFLKNQFLRTVDLRNNQIARLPESIYELNILWKLRLDYNLLQDLPQSIHKLQRLEILTISNNKLKTIPSGLFQLTEKLGMLQLNDNLIKKVPREIGQLVKLKILLLHNNLISIFPHEIMSLSDLNEFSLEWFQYLNPPMNKILKDERGLLIIKDFQKFCKTMSELSSRSSCSFTHFLAYFHNIQDIQQLQNLNQFAKSRSVVHYICLNGHLHLLKHLMKYVQGLDVNYADKDGTTPLVLAFKNKQNSIIKYLMKYPITNFNKGSSKYGFPLQQAIRNHSFKIVMNILKPKYVVNINAIDEEGSNALHYLMSHFGSDPDNSSKICNILLKKGIEVNLLNKAELSPIHIAVKGYQSKALKYVLQYNQFVRRQQALYDNNNQFIFTDSQSNPFSQRHKQQTFDFNMQGKNKWSPLHYAVFYNNVYAVEFFLHACKLEKINFFVRDSEGRLPQDLCPYNSPIYKMVTKKQRQIFEAKMNSDQKEGSNKKIADIVNQKIEQRFINRKQMKKKQNGRTSRQVDFEPKMNQIRRHNSNAQIGKAVLTNLQSNYLHFGAQESSDESQEGIDRNNKRSVMIQDLSDGDENTIVSNKSFNNNLINRLGGLATSKTEKYLLTGRVDLLSNNKSQQKQRLDENGFQQQTFARNQQFNYLRKFNQQNANKQSPRMLRPLSPLLPKTILNTEDGLGQQCDDMPFFTEEAIDEGGPIEELKFISNHVNFCTVQEETKGSGDESQCSSSEQSSMDTSLDKSLRQDFYFSEQLKMKKQKSNQIEGSSMDLIGGNDQSQFQSVPAQSQGKHSRIASEVQQEQLMHLAKRYGQPNYKQSEHDDEEDDFCCEAEEDIETGAIGMMTNKINKFENHNYNLEIEHRSITQKSALKKIMQQLNEYRRKKQDGKEYSKQNTEQLNRNFRILDSMNDQKIFSLIDSEIDLMPYQRDEGNVFDTVDHLEDVASPKIPSDHQLLKNGVNENKFMSKFNDNDSSSQALKSVSCKNDDVFSAHGGLGKMQQLNKDCKIYDTRTTTQNGSEHLFEMLNDPSISISQKYQLIYKSIYTKNGLIDDKLLKLIFEAMDDGDTNFIIKADLSYLLTVSKNKDHIPVLDSALSKLKDQGKVLSKQSTQVKLIHSASQTKVLNFTDINKSPKQLDQSDITTPKEAKITQQRSQASQQKLVIYETCNAYDMLMNEAMHQSKQQMEKCNQKIHFERERSREKMKFKHLTSNTNITSRTNDYYQQIGEISQFTRRKEINKEGNQSIREIPQLVTRLNKSPSSQNFYGQRFQENPFNCNIQIPQQISMQSPNNISDENSSKDGYERGFQQKKTSFTPKGSSGQIFLAFQRQKQSRGQGFHKQNTMIEECEHLTVMDMENDDDHENYNETTILKVQKPQETDSSRVGNNMTSQAIIQEEKHFKFVDEEELDKEVQKQRSRLETYIQKRKEELSKQQLVNKNKDKAPQIFLQQQPSKKNMLDKSQTSLQSTRTKTVQKQKSRIGLQRQQSPTKIQDISIDCADESKLKKNQMLYSHHHHNNNKSNHNNKSINVTNKKTTNDNTTKTSTNQVGLSFGLGNTNKSQIRAFKNSSQAATNSRVMKKSTSTSKLTSDSSYLGS